MSTNGQSESQYKYLDVTSHDDGRIARILMNRPEYRNAQNRGLLAELDDAFLACRGGRPCACSHSGWSRQALLLRSRSGNRRSQGRASPRVLTNNGHSAPTERRGQGAEARMLQEWHYFFNNALRWRNLRKITIAQVQGPGVRAD